MAARSRSDGYDLNKVERLGSASWLNQFNWFEPEVGSDPMNSTTGLRFEISKLRFWENIWDSISTPKIMKF